MTPSQVARAMAEALSQQIAGGKVSTSTRIELAQLFALVAIAEALEATNAPEDTDD